MIKTKNPNETVKMICVDNILSFSENPYKVIDNEEMDELVKSIEERGILSPLVLRGFEDDPNRFELVSGHRRLFAAKKSVLLQFRHASVSSAVMKRQLWLLTATFIVSIFCPVKRQKRTSLNTTL